MLRTAVNVDLNAIVLGCFHEFSGSFFAFFISSETITSPFFQRFVNNLFAVRPFIIGTKMAEIISSSCIRLLLNCRSPV
jgi:hypothetical protein